jgi:hypothetical protein
MIAVRWYLPAPRGASSYPRRSREELEGRFLGPMAYLDAKVRGNGSLPEKQRSCPGVRSEVLRDPCDMAKLRREALCRIPDAVGENSEGRS